LDKQFRRLTTKPRTNGMLMLAIVGVFFAGIAVGGSFSANENKPATTSTKVSLVGSFSVR
jgi:hypothetical protein